MKPNTTKKWWSIVPPQNLVKRMEVFMMLTGDSRQDIVVAAVEEYLKSHLSEACDRFQTRVKAIQSEANRIVLEN